MTSGELELGIRLPWYRSLPVSVVEVGELTIDGKPVSMEEVRFGINGREFGLDELKDRTGEFWYVLDSARMRVRRMLDPGLPHSISLTLNLYPPYIPGLTWITRGSIELEGHR